MSGLQYVDSLCNKPLKKSEVSNADAITDNDKTQQENEVSNADSNAVSNADETPPYSFKFPDSFVLDYDTFYENSKYNNIRRCKLLMIAQCFGKCPQLDEKKKQGEIIKNAKRFTNKLLSIKLISTFTASTSIIKHINKFLYNTIISKEYVVTQLEKGCLKRALSQGRKHNIRCIW